MEGAAREVKAPRATELPFAHTAALQEVSRFDSVGMQSRCSRSHCKSKVRRAVEMAAALVEARAAQEGMEVVAMSGMVVEGEGVGMAQEDGVRAAVATEG